MVQHGDVVQNFNLQCFSSIINVAASLLNVFTQTCMISVSLSQEILMVPIMADGFYRVLNAGYYQ